MLSVDVMLIDQTSRFLSNNIDILYIMNIATHSKYLHSWRGVRDTTLCDKVVPKNIKLNYIIINKIVITIMKEYNYQLAVFIKKNTFRVRLMVFNANFNNISVISWRSILLVA
jgi:hypothetical protein